MIVWVAAGLTSVISSYCSSAFGWQVASYIFDP